MFKLCKTCGYINKGDAIECEECHSLLDINPSNKTNDIQSNKSAKKDKKISISDIFNIKKDISNFNSKNNNTDAKYINDFEIAIEDNNIEIIENTPNKETESTPKQEPIIEKPKEEPIEIEEPIKKEDASINIEKEIIIDDNTITEIEPDETTATNSFVDMDTYNEIPVEDITEETIEKQDKESDEIPSDDNVTAQLSPIDKLVSNSAIYETSKEIKTKDISVQKEEKVFNDTTNNDLDISIKEEPTIKPIEKQKPTESDITIEEKAAEIAKITDSIKNNTIEPVEVNIATSKEEPSQETKETELEIKENIEIPLDDDPFISQIQEEERIKKEKIELEEAKRKEEDERIKKVIKEALKEVVENNEEPRNRRQRPILDEEEPKEISPLENLKMDEPTPSNIVKPKKVIAAVKPMEIKKRTNENLNKVGSEDDSLQDAMDVFDSIGTKPSGNNGNTSDAETVVYDLVGSTPKHETKPAHIETKSDLDKEEDDDLIDPSKKKLLGKKSKKKNKKGRKEKKEKKNLSIVQRSIAISAVLAFAIIAVVIITRINKNKELNLYAQRLISNQDVSYQQVYDALAEKGYSEKEILGAIANLDADFNQFALNVLYSAALDTNKLATKEEAKALLTRNGFSNSEIESAMTTPDVWKSYLVQHVEACIAKIKELNKKTIINNIKDAKFSADEIKFIEDNINWAKLAKKNIDSYVSEEIHTKEEINIYLLELGYSEKDVTQTFEEYEWDSYANKYLTKYLEQKEAEGNPIELSRPAYTEILSKAGFTNEEISKVMGRYDFASYASSKVDTLITEGKDFVNKRELKDALAKEGYTTEEIEKALAETNWNEAAITSLKSLDNTKLSKNEMLKALADAGYEEKELEYATTTYEWTVQGLKYIEYLKTQKKNGNEVHLRTVLRDAGYSVEEINKLITSLNFEKSVDWFEEAAKADLNSIKETDNFSRKKAKEHLTGLNYGEKEINAAINAISYADWKRYASNYLSGITFNTRVEARDRLQNEGFVNSSENKEIDYALQSVNWSAKCKTYANSIYSQNDSQTQNKDYCLYKEGNITSIEQTLQKAEFAQDEIRPALNEIFSNKSFTCPIS